MLYCGEQIGDGSQDPKVDIAVDPLDGTTLISQVRSALPPPCVGLCITACYVWCMASRVLGW